MSLSPPSATVDDDEDYRAGWQALMRQLRRGGKSLSGNERNCAFLNTAEGQFANISAATGLDFSDDARGVALTDWDQDGDLDLWLTNRTGPRLRLMLNGSGETPAAHRWLALGLRGTRGNRDAIGARVEVETAGRRHVRSLSAGDGFLSQSSKWLHFGLGDEDSIRRVVVRWPGGRREVFEGLDADRRYLLVEGSGAAQAMPPRNALPALRPATQRSPAPAGSQAFFSQRFPAVELPYTELDGGTPRSAAAVSSPRLVNLWAGWCAPCLAELRELTARAAQLREAGVDVLALNVEGLDEDEATDPGAARRVLDGISFPFPAGLATPELLDKLDLLQEFLFSRVPTFAVPTSLLLDRRGRPAALYRGPVSVEHLLADVARLDAAPADPRDAAVPFPGRWVRPNQPRFLYLEPLAALFQESYPEDAMRILAAALEELAQLRRTLATTPERSRRLDADEAKLSLRLARLLEAAGRGQEAVQRYGVASRLEPDNPEPYVRVGEILQSRGRMEDAVRFYQRALEADPDHPDALNDMGAALAGRGRLAQALPYYERALQADPDHSGTHGNLGLLRFLEGRTADSIRHYRAALEGNPDDARLRYGLGVALGAEGDAPAALEQFRESLRLAPDSVGALTDAAWILATHPDAEVRDPDEAIRLARRAVEVAGAPDATALDTLAAAYAAAGQFDPAVASVRSALELASRDGEQELARFLERRLALYSAGRPYVESP